MGPLELFGVITGVLGLIGVSAKDLVQWIKINGKEPFSIAFTKTVKEFKGKFPHIEDQLGEFLGSAAERKLVGDAALDSIDWDPLITALAEHIDPFINKDMTSRLEVKGILTFFSNALDEAYLNSDQKAWYADRKRKSSDERIIRSVRENISDTREILNIVSRSNVILSQLQPDKVSVLGDLWKKRVEKCVAVTKERGPAKALAHWEALVEEIEAGEAREADLLFEVYTNLASCLWGVGQREKAKPFLIKAFEAKPGEKRAKLNRGLAYLLDGKLGLAHEMVDGVLESDPADPKALSVKASLLVAEGKFPEVVALFDPYLDRDSGNLTVGSADCYRSLGYALLEVGDLATAIKTLKQALASAPEDAGLKGLLAVALAASVPRGVGLTDEGRSALVDADALLSEAVDPYRAQGLVEDLSETLSNRAGIRLRLNRLDDAFKDAKEAYHYVPQGMVRRNYFITCNLIGRESEAMEVLEEWAATPSDVDLDMTTLALQFLSTVEDKGGLERARQLIAGKWPGRGLADLPVDVLEAYSDLLLEHDQMAEADVIGTILQRNGQAAHGLIISGRIAYTRGDSSAAVDFLVQARTAAAEAHDETALVVVARYLAAWQSWSEAVNTFQMLGVTPWSPRSIVANFLISMYHADVVRHEDAILQLAEGYRLNRGLDLAIIQIEIAVLETRGHFEKVVTLLSEVLQQQPGREQVRLELALALHRLGDKVRSAATAQELKMDKDLSPLDYLRAAALLLRHDEPQRSLEFAFEGWRVGRRSAEINLGYVQAFLSATHHYELDLEVEQVAPGSIVTVEFENGDRETYVIATGTQAGSLDQEISLSDEISHRLLGHRQGDLVDWRQTYDGISSVTVKEIRHRFVWAFQTALASHHKRFPGDSSMEEIDVEEDLSTVFRVLDRHETAMSEAIGRYQTTPLPFGALSKLTGRSIYETWTGMLTGGRLSLFVSQSTLDETAREHDAIKARSIVVEPLFLFTQQHLGRLEQLAHRFDRILVPQQVVDAIRVSREEVGRHKEGQIRVGKAADGTYFRQEIRREHLDFAATFLDSVLDFCEKKCDRVGRERQYTSFEASFAQLVGDEFMVPLTVAQSTGVVLASDDAKLRQFAFHEYGIPGLSSTTLVTYEPDDEVHAEAMVRLLQAHYRNVPISIRALLTVAKKGLSPHGDDMKLLLDKLFSESVSSQSVLKVSLGFMSQLLIDISYFGVIELFLDDLLNRVYERLGPYGYGLFKSTITQPRLVEVPNVTRAKQFIERWEAARKMPPPAN